MASDGSRFVRCETWPGGYAIVTLCKEPVNSLDRPMWEALHAALKRLEADASINGVIFASGLKKDVFTAGNDLSELYAPATSADRYAAFWHTQNAFLVDLYRSRLATVAAIRGACPAGGCCIAMACDARIMTQQGNIGLNEVAIGIPVPKFWAGLMARTIGARAAEALVLNGRLVSSHEALKLGLVDELADSNEALMARAEQLVQAAIKLPSKSRAATKSLLREQYCADWAAYYVDEAKWGWESLVHPQTVKVLGATLARLSGGKAGAKPAGSSKL